MSKEEVEESIKNAVSGAAKGGGFTLRTTGGNANISAYLDRERFKKIIKNTEVYIEASLKFGEYPVRE